MVKMNLLPNADNAIIPFEKLFDYALCTKKNKDKAVAFKQCLGYCQENAEALIENIRANIKNFPAIAKGDIGYGMRYEIFMRLTGANGKTAKVKTGWIVDSETGITRLTSAYISNKKLEEELL